MTGVGGSDDPAQVVLVTIFECFFFLGERLASEQARLNKISGTISGSSLGEGGKPARVARKQGLIRCVYQQSALHGTTYSQAGRIYTADVFVDIC